MRTRPEGGESGEEEREELKDEPCTVTAPAAAAGHRGPVWATKIGGDNTLWIDDEELGS
jgi:hypothetical protein